MANDNPRRGEILALLRRADCHYGNALRDEEAGWTVEHAARERDEVRLDRIIGLRRAVRIVADGELSQTKVQAGHEGGVVRALLHFESEMSDGLRGYISARLAQLQPEFGLTATLQPLRCVTRGTRARRRGAGDR